MKKRLNVAIIGQGRSGKLIHGAYFKTTANEEYTVVAVVDFEEERRARALAEYPGCRVFEKVEELFPLKDEIDLVVNSTFSDLHYSVSKTLLEHGFNVLVEKPMARTYYDCCDLIKTAKDNGVIIAAFQQTFLAPFHIKAKEIVASGKIGRPTQVAITYNGFSRRWDWQTLQHKMAGGLYNTGPHPVGLALDWLDFSPDTKVAFSKLDIAMTSGDADDYAKLILTAPGKPVVDVEVCSNDAYPDGSLVKILGTRGTLYVNRNGYKLKYYVESENEERPVIETPLRDENGNPVYCGEKLEVHEEEGVFDNGVDTTAHTSSGENANTRADLFTKRFYDGLYKTLTEGAPLPVPVEYAAHVISVIETAHAQNKMEVKF